MNKKNIIIIILILIILVIISIISFYKLKIYNKDYNIINLSNNLIKSDINYKEKYNEYIYDDSTFNSLNFPVVNEENAIYYLFEKIDDYLILKNLDSNESIKPINEKFKSMTLVTNDETDEFMYIYLITKEGNFYKIELKSHNPIKLNIEKLNKKIKVDSFLTGVEYDTYRDIPNYSIPVFDTNDKIYIMPSESLFIPNMQMVKDNIIVYEDKKISSLDGRILKDKSKKDYKVKWVFEITEDNPFYKNPEILIITEDNKIIYLIEDKIYEYKKEISDINYTYISEESGTLDLKYDDDSTMKLDIQFDLDNYGFIIE